MAMLYPTYNDLIKVANQGVEDGEEPVVKSRYSIVVGTAKRARQIIDGAPILAGDEDMKPLSIAVEEFYEGKVSIIPGSVSEDEAGEEAADNAEGRAEAEVDGSASVSENTEPGSASMDGDVSDAEGENF